MNSSYRICLHAMNHAFWYTTVWYNMVTNVCLNVEEEQSSIFANKKIVTDEQTVQSNVQT